MTELDEIDNRGNYGNLKSKKKSRLSLFLQVIDPAGSQTDLTLPDVLKRYYRYYFEFSLFLSLLILVFIMRYFPEFSSETGRLPAKPNIVVEISDIAPTRQIVSAKGKPVKPVIPIAGNVKEELLFDDDANLGDEFGLLPIPAPPPPPVNNEKSDYQPPRLIVSKFPEYPKELQKLGISGVVILEVKVDVSGKVIEHRIRSNTTNNVTLEKLAVETVYQCRYTPAMQDKKPVVAWTDHKFEFMDKQRN